MRRVVLAIVVLVTGLLAGAPWASAQDHPQISIDRSEVAPGDPVIVTLTGFSTQQVTVAVCGNLASRGSTDCNMPSAQSERIRDTSDVTLTQLFAVAPPTPCPCLVLAYSPSSDEFAVAAITLTGHPVAPVVEPDFGQPLVEVSVAAERVGAGLGGSVRTALAGPTTYRVTVGVRNITTEAVRNVELAGVARHRFTDAVTLELAAPGEIQPGQTVEQTVEVEVPAPVIGDFDWEVSAYGAGPTVEGATSVSNRPVLLYAVALLFVVDVVVIVVRMGRRRRPGEAPAGVPDEPETWEEIQAAWDAEDADSEDGELVPAGA